MNTNTTITGSQLDHQSSGDNKRNSLDKNDGSHEMTTTTAPIPGEVELLMTTPPSAKEFRKLVRKIDLRIMPYLWGYAVLSAVDKIIISNASLYGMNDDTHLSGHDYSWIGSIFYFGYLASEFPLVVFLLPKIPLGKFLSVLAFGWGLMTLLMGLAAHDAGSLMALRFVMGMLEAPALPGLTLATTMWYTKREQPLRVALWSSTVASVYVGLVSYGIGHAKVPGLANWRLLFVLLGAISIVFSILMFIFFPDRPEKGRFLSEREAWMVVERKREDNTGIENRTFKWYQVREALVDWKSWAISLFFLCMNVSNGGLNTFSAQIVSGFGFDDLTTVLVGMPTGVIQALSSILATIPGRYFPNTRCLSAAACCLVALVCSIVIREVDAEKSGGRLLAAYYFFYFFWGPYAVALSLPMANTSGHTKKLTVNAMVFLAYCVANIVAPQTFLESQAPHYTDGYNSIAGFESAAIAIMIAYILGVRWENSRRDKLYGSPTPPTLPAMVNGGDIEDAQGMVDDDDRTDWEKTNFRYVC